jgi:hypothetical protein
MPRGEDRGGDEEVFFVDDLLWSYLVTSVVASANGRDALNARPPQPAPRGFGPQTLLPASMYLDESTTPN